MTPAGPEAEVLPLPFCWHAFSVRCREQCDVLRCDAVPFLHFTTLCFGFGILLLGLSLLLLIIFLWLSACKTLPCFQLPHTLFLPPPRFHLHSPAPCLHLPFERCSPCFVLSFLFGFWASFLCCQLLWQVVCTTAVCVFTLCNHFICQTWFADKRSVDSLTAQIEPKEGRARFFKIFRLHKQLADLLAD